MPYLHRALASFRCGVCQENPAARDGAARHRYGHGWTDRGSARRSPAAADQSCHPPPAGAGGPHASDPALQAVGVDEWAWRRGHRYGTILVNLTDHHVMDLLPDRSAASVAAWLGQHPTITTVCRDRSDLYADGSLWGVPGAVRVVDRFHLVQNLRQASEGVLLDRRLMLQAAAVCTAMAFTTADGAAPVIPGYRGRCRSPTPAPQPAERRHRHARWVTIDETLHRLSAQGTPIATMAHSWVSAARPSMPTSAKARRPAPDGFSGGHPRGC